MEYMYAPAFSARHFLVCRIMRKVPDTIEGFEPLAAQLLTDRHHGVLLTGVTLMLEVCACEELPMAASRRANLHGGILVRTSLFLWCQLSRRRSVLLACLPMQRSGVSDAPSERVCCASWQVCAVNPKSIEGYRKHVPQLCKILRSLLMSGSTLSGEHDVGGITDPFLQAKVWRLCCCWLSEHSWWLFSWLLFC